MKSSFFRCSAFGAALLLIGSVAHASFRDDFDKPIQRDPSGVNDWNYQAGDGTAGITFNAKDGIATLSVDGTTDRRGIWWAFIKREISSQIDIAELTGKGKVLRVEARIRSSHAPKRINLSVNTQHTTDFHGDLMEFDLGEANVWQTISFTAKGFDVRPGDQLNVQLAMMDWGLGRYHVDIDYMKVDVVDPTTVGPDLGVPVPYRPAIADPKSFKNALPAVAAASIDRREPDANLNDWSAIEAKGPVRVLTANGTQYVILRWDLSKFAGRKAAGSGLLDIKTHSIQRPAERRKDFGMMRVVEIIGGDPKWTDATVTYDSISQGHPYEEVFNTQMIIDVDLNDTYGESTLITLSRPVMQRILDGRTKGIILVPLGSINAAFLPETDAANAPMLRFNVSP
jgi:hypothetical protein